MIKPYFTLLFLFFVSLCFSQTKVFINEIHYDNASSDSNEGIEIAGPSGTNLSNYKLTLYNGGDNSTYGSVIKLSGVIPNQSNGFGTLFFSIAGLQNGSPDGVALENNGILIQFLSYEGTITAIDGIAAGQTSTDIGVSESGSTSVGESLQLKGTGATYEHFTWSGPSKSSYNAINSGQTFSSTAGYDETKIPEIHLFPNPSASGFLSVTSQLKGLIRIKFYNTIGQLVLETTVNDSLIDIRNLVAGLYLVKILQNRQTTTKKLIVK